MQEEVAIERLEPVEWHHCYGESWKGLAVPEAISHPAKMSRALLQRIIDHGFLKGYWHKNDLIGDCFGGIGSTGIICSYNGLRSVLVELEPAFVGFAEKNFALHQNTWKAMNLPEPVIIQGDSRFFNEQVSAILSSPPYADSVNSKSNGIDWEKAGRPDRTKPSADRISPGVDAGLKYGETSGQIGNLKSGSIDAAISSPPFSAPNMQPCIGQGVRKDMVAAGKSPENNYGATEGQIAVLKPGNLDGIVSSPPFEDSLNSKDEKFNAVARPGRIDQCSTYGESDGQIGNSKGETYWEAVRQCYQSAFKAIKPNGVIALVCKDYCKNGVIVPLCDDTLRLLVHCGFEPLERIHAMLVEETREAGLMGDDVVTVKSRKSFFRRIYEAKGGPRIDYEVVLICRRP